MHCFIHSQQEAVGSCVECGHGVCLLCLNKVEGRIYCDACARQAAHLRRDSGALRSTLDEVRLSNLIQERNRYMAAVLAITLGTFGAHKFYLGQFGWGLIYLLFFWSGIPAMAGLVEGVWYLSLSDQAFNLRYYGGSLPLSLNHTPAPSPLRASPAKTVQPFTQPLYSDADYERCLLHYARAQKGRLTIGQIVADTPITIEKAEHYLSRLEARGYTRVEIDPETGVIRYLFPEFMYPSSLQPPDHHFRDK